jgi:hypothetical protein
MLIRCLLPRRYGRLFSAPRYPHSRTIKRVGPAEWTDQPILAIGTHYPAPTAGHVVSDGAAYRFEPIYADARLLKLGRRLATVDVRI